MATVLPGEGVQCDQAISILLTDGGLGCHSFYITRTGDTFVDLRLITCGVSRFLLRFWDCPSRAVAWELFGFLCWLVCAFMTLCRRAENSFAGDSDSGSEGRP
jgi:hypothetical protein